MSGAARRSRLAAFLLFSLVLIAGGDPYGGREPLWNLYFETDPRLMDRGTARGFPGTTEGGAGTSGNLSSRRSAPASTGRPLMKGGGRCCPGNIVVVLPGSSPMRSSSRPTWTGPEREGGRWTIFPGGDAGDALCLLQGSTSSTYAGLRGVRRGGDGTGGLATVRREERLDARAVTAVVNLECLGVTLPRPWAEGSSDRLENILTEVGKKRGIDLGRYR